MSTKNKNRIDISVGDTVVASLSEESGRPFKDLFQDSTKPDWFPANGTRGVVKEIFKNSGKVLVDWEPGSTTYCYGVDEWWCPISWVTKLENSQV